MSPLQHALLDLPDTADQSESYRVQLATARELDAETARHDRRADRRRRDDELGWIRRARLNGHSVSIVDLSAGGALIDSPAPLRPDSVLTLEIAGRGFDEAIQFRVVRCHIGSLQPGKPIYRGACEFSRRIDLPTAEPARARVLYPGRFGGPELAIPREPSSHSLTVPVEAPPALGWQKIVVRYTEGQLLKGYTHDFNPARSQFSLSPSPLATPQDRVIVSLARLKGVFFVRDFAGNPAYVERTDTGHPQHGRRIEVTLLDNEVIAGRTLNYRPDGYGFFVMPADPLANNIRVFVVATAVRQVRFP
ncbi:MAG TPA: PilZ domain-containing protein [Vicinamibacterales bacterium]|nr:PilZ domain-containing protein [Vicinamibacterales bacterium]